MLNMGRYGSREILNLQILDYQTATPIMYFDYANTASDEKAAERVYATGGSGGVRRIKFDGQKTQTLTVETQIFSMQHLALLSGNKITSGTKNINKVEQVRVEDDGSNGMQVTIKRVPIGVNAIAIKKFVNGISVGDVQPVESITKNVIKLDAKATVSVGDMVEVFYQFESPDTHTVTYTTKGIPGYVTLIGDSFYTDEVGENGQEGNLVAMQKKYFKAALQPNYTVTHNPTGDPASLTLTFDIFGIKVDGEDVMAEETIYEDKLA